MKVVCRSLIVALILSAGIWVWASLHPKEDPFQRVFHMARPDYLRNGQQLLESDPPAFSYYARFRGCAPYFAEMCRKLELSNKVDGPLMANPNGEHFGGDWWRPVDVYDLAANPALIHVESMKTLNQRGLGRIHRYSDGTVDRIDSIWGTRACVKNGDIYLTRIDEIALLKPRSWLADLLCNPIVAVED